MPTKKLPVDMRRALRITGFRDAPQLPKPEREDYLHGIWRGVNKPSWNVLEAAHYLDEFLPGQKLMVHDAEKVERTRFWLQEELIKSLGRDEASIVKIRKSPGFFIRLLWEAYRPFSLKIWSLYYEADQGRVTFRVSAHLLAKRYKDAAEIVWREFSDASVDEVAEFLNILPHNAKGEGGAPIFASRSIETLKDYIKPYARVGRGHRTISRREEISQKSSHLIGLIEKELG